MKQTQFLPIDDLLFDSNNPRFFAEGWGEAELLQRMIDRENVIELMLSIGQGGFFGGEPLVVVPEGPKYVVVEGNRRLAAVKLLINPELAPSRNGSVRKVATESNASLIPKELPCVIFESRVDTYKFLGFRHITGAKPWGPLAKAQFLQTLQKQLSASFTFKEQCKELAASIGSTPATVRYLLLSLKLYSTIAAASFYEIEGLSRDTFEFGVFYTAVKAKDIFEFLGAPETDAVSSETVNLTNLEDLTRWLFEKIPDPDTGKSTTRVGESRNLVRLAKVVRNEEALNAFQSGKVSLAVAAVMAGEEIESFQADCLASLNKLKLASSRLSSIREQLDSSDERLTDEIRFESEELHQSVRKQVRLNKSAVG